MDDERITWVRAAPGRKIVQTIEPIPNGFSVTTEWVGSDPPRKDCEIVLREMPGMGGDAGKLT